MEVTTIIKNYDPNKMQTTFTIGDRTGLRHLEIRLRDGSFVLWTRNVVLKEVWHPVKTSQADNRPDAERELYYWALAQNWNVYSPEQEAMI
jgi:hypothetical protein